MGRWWVILAVLAGALLAACGGKDAGDDERDSDEIPYTLPGSSPPRDEHELYTEASVWVDHEAQDHITETCFLSGPTDADSRRFCVEQLMYGFDAPEEAVAFFLATDRWMIGIIGATQIRAAFLLEPDDTQGLPALAFLSREAGVLPFAQLFDEAFPRTSEADAWPFEDDPDYPALFELAQETFRGADDPLDLRHFDVAEVEGARELSDGGHRFTVQLGIHNFCLACGVGIAGRYELDFDANGEIQQFEYLDMCQGPEVTEEVEDLGEITYHRFSGVQASAQTGVFREPYLLILPELSQCPSTMRLVD